MPALNALWGVQTNMLASVFQSEPIWGKCLSMLSVRCALSSVLTPHGIGWCLLMAMKKPEQTWFAEMMSIPLHPIWYTSLNLPFLHFLWLARFSLNLGRIYPHDIICKFHVHYLDAVHFRVFRSIPLCIFMSTVTSLTDTQPIVDLPRGFRNALVLDRIIHRWIIGRINFPASSISSCDIPSPRFWFIFHVHVLLLTLCSFLSGKVPHSSFASLLFDFFFILSLLLCVLSIDLCE